MQRVVAPAPDGMACDTNTRQSPGQLEALKAQGYGGIARYVSLHMPSSSADITAAEVENIMQAGMGLWLVQHVLYPGWHASADLGTELGQAAQAHARQVGYLPGAHLALDLEGCASAGQPVIDYVNAWADAVRSVYPVLLYVGYAAGLTPDELFHALPDVHAYWSDFGRRSVSVRGFCVRQHPQVGAVDPDTLQADQLGGRLQWMIQTA